MQTRCGYRGDDYLPQAGNERIEEFHYYRTKNTAATACGWGLHTFHSRPGEGDKMHYLQTYHHELVEGSLAAFIGRMRQIPPVSHVAYGGRW